MTSPVPKIRTSERVTFKRCPRAWWWSYREGLRPRRAADPLWFGGLVHVAFAGWYCGPGLTRGPHPAETFQEISNDSLRSFKVADATEDERAKYIDMQALGVAMLEAYVERYGRDEHCLMIAPEQTFSFDIPFPEWWGATEDERKIMAQYVGTFDGVYRDAATGFIWLWEHKTAKSIKTGHLPLDEQGGSYWAIAERALKKAGLIKETDRLAGIMYNFARKALPDLRPVDAQGYACNKPIKADYVRALTPVVDQLPEQLAKLTLDQLSTEAAVRELVVLGERSKVQPAPLFHREPVKRTRAERRSQLIRIQNDAAVMEMARRGEIPITKTTHSSCQRCDFEAMCKLEETGGAWRDLRDAAYRQEDPYADHRKSAEDLGGFDL